MRTHPTQGRGTDCTRKFKEAWTRFAADEANLTEFMAAKRRRRRVSKLSQANEKRGTEAPLVRI
jgi:hypothetical protein